jgi:acyl-CoA thioesterase-1
MHRNPTPIGIIAGLVLTASSPFGAAATSFATPSVARSSGESRGAADGTTAPRLLCLGTSLTAGFGLDPDQAWPAVLQEKVDQAGLRYRVVNAGVSGETSAGARRRIDWLLREPAAVLVVETGANDGLRGQEPEATRANLRAILDRARQSPPPARGRACRRRLGASYTQRFRAVFPEVAKEYGAAYVPFLLDGVAGVARLNQADGIHPTPEGQRLVAENVWRVLKPLLVSPGAAGK